MASGGFFHNSGSESEDDYTSDETESSEAEIAPSQKPGRGILYGGSSGSEEEVGRVVRSQKDKRYEEMNNTINNIRNALKINDWVVCQTEFESLMRVVTKANAIIERDGIPRNFIKCFAELEDAMEAAWANKDARKKMSTLNMKGLSTVKQKLRKQKQNYEAELTKHRENPDATETEPEEDDDSEDDDTFFEKPEDDEATAGVFVTTKKGKKSKTAAPEEAPKNEFVPENVEKKLNELLLNRGKKNTDRKQQIEILVKLAGISDTPYLTVRVLVALISSQFDQSIGMSQYISADVWRSAHANIIKLITILEENPNIILRHGVDEESAEATKEEAKPDQKQYVVGGLISMVEKLDDELTKCLQNIDPHSSDYIDRLRDELLFYEAIVKTQLYYERTEETELLCQTIIRRVEHMYYRKDHINDKIEEKVQATLSKELPKISGQQHMHQLCSFLYKNANERMRTRALLCHVYHHALHNRFYKARDMLLMSHLQETVHHTDIPTQILYNRTMVQVGLCAFKHGLLKEAQSALQEIFASGKVKELVAQGIMSRYAEKSQEQETLEKQRQIPFHMHINLELPECIHWTCSMLLEIPYMAANNHEARKRVISKPFRRILDFSERQVFSGPPENTREHVMQAAKALMMGDWERCRDLILSVKLWDLIDDEGIDVKAMLAEKIQHEGLRTFLFTFSNFYESLNVQHLATMFKLPKNEVHSIISKMIINEELHASLDQFSDLVILHQVEPSRLHFLSLQMSEKIGVLVESNEKLLDLRTGSLYKDDRQKRGRLRQDGRGSVSGAPSNRNKDNYTNRF